nr:hypothetical protein [Tanacetum cinerariifolium]
MASSKCNCFNILPEVISSSSSNVSHQINRKRTKSACKKSLKRSQKMKDIRPYHEKFIDLFTKACKGQVDLGNRSKSDKFWNFFAKDFNLEINMVMDDGLPRVNFTGDQCRSYAATLQRHTRLKMLHPDQEEKFPTYSILKC